jgi:hypothetical protein
MPIVQAVYTATFDDGTQWVGAADCNINNTDAKFRNYPTAVAESRAEARCLRKALSIRILSSEEVGMSEPFSELQASPTGGIDDAVIEAITSLCDSRNVDQATAIEAVVKPNRAAQIFELKHLTSAEGQRIMAWLNEQSVSKKVNKKTAAEQREDRKKELQEELSKE